MKELPEWAARQPASKAVESVCWFEPDPKRADRVVLKIDRRGKPAGEIEAGLRQWSRRRKRTKRK